MGRKENSNNMFKYATKELSQDAFICWCINWINYKDHKLYNLGKEMLNVILFPSIKNEYLFPNYEKEEIELKLKKRECKEVDDLYYKKNEEILKIKRNIDEDKKVLNNKIDVDKITNLKIVRQFKKMVDIVITINREFVVIIEDKINGTTNKQLERYSEIMKNEVINDETALDLLELDKNKFKISDIIPVYMKTGQFTFDEKTISFRRITGVAMLNVLEKFKNENDIIHDFYICLSEKLRREDEKKYKELIKKEYLKTGEKFEKKFVIYKCFGINVDKNYTGKMNLRLKGGGVDLSDKISIWTPRLFNFTGWSNIYNEEEGIITSTGDKLIEIDKEKPYKYVFARKRDTFGDEYFEFIGVFYLDVEESTKEKSVWKKYQFKNEIVTLDYKKLEKELDEKLKI